MKIKKLIILHFNILEKYPPAMNFIFDVLSQKPDYKISVITSFNSSPFVNQKFEGVKIFRLALISENSIKRYLSYLVYNIFSVLILFIKRPDVVVAYETLSIFPTLIYSKIFKNKKIHVHYHEYVSPGEKELASGYMKFLFLCESSLLKKHTCSQTNEDRKALFLKDNPFLIGEKVEVYPNLPPKTWWLDYGQYKKPNQSGKIKLVYVGVLDAETMFLEEILKWVVENSEDLELTFFSQSISNSAKELLHKFESSSIVLKPALNYYQLPIELVRHDVGLVLYKGHIPNYVFNVPNKVFEYLSCGLKIISDPVLYSLSKLNLSDAFILELNNLNKVCCKSIRAAQTKPIENWLVKQSCLTNKL